MARYPVFSCVYACANWVRTRLAAGAPAASGRGRKWRGSCQFRAAEPLEARVLLTTFTVVNTSNSGAGSLRQAVADANASPGQDTIEFSGSVFGDSTPDTIALTGGRITISDDLIIQGTGTGLLRITANSRSQLFYVTGASTDVTISDLTLTGGRAAGATTETQSGGAVYINNAGLTLEDVSLSANSATADGGGLFNAFGTVTFINGSVTNNTAIRGGGGLGSQGQLNVVGGTFSGNSARYGGAIAVGQQGTLDLSGSGFASNTASVDGSAIVNYFGSAAVVSATFVNNSAELSGTVANFGNLTLSDSQFTGNYAYYGAGIANDAAGTMVVSRSTFNGGTAGREGGALINGGGMLTIIDSDLSRNVSTGVGGALSLVRGGTTFISGTTMANNIAGRGGAITNTHNSLLHISNSTISSNESNEAGGGIFNNGDMTVTNSTIVGNRSDRDGNGGGGGGIYTNDAPLVQTHLFNTIVAGNRKGSVANQTWNDIGGIKLLAADSAYNLISTPDAAGGLVHGVNGNIVGQSSGGGARTRIPLAEIIDFELKDNGGPTPTHALAAGSLAINAGSNGLALDAGGAALSTDQRGIGFPRIVGGTVDIGAFEV